MSEQIITIEPAQLNDSVIETAKDYQIKLNIKSVVGHQVVVEYRCLPGYHPSSDGNQLHIWKGETVLWKDRPDKSALIPSNSQWGALVINGLNFGENDYILGYCVGRGLSKTAATAYIPLIEDEKPREENYKYFRSKLEVTAVGDTFVSFMYETPNGYDPQGFGAWVGLWEKNQVPHPATQYMAQTSIPYTTETGDHYFDNVQLAKGHNYSIGLFMGDMKESNPVCLAASCTFTY